MPPPASFFTRRAVKICRLMQRERVGVVNPLIMTVITDDVCVCLIIAHTAHWRSSRDTRNCDPLQNMRAYCRTGCILPLHWSGRRCLRRRFLGNVLCLVCSWPSAQWFACETRRNILFLTLNIPSLARQRCLPSWGPRRTPWFFFFL